MRASPEVRLMAKTRPTGSGCLEWTGFRNRLGYGRIAFHGKACAAHRVAYELFAGPVPVGLELDHLCGNRACVNVAHLEPVSHLENVRRGRAGEKNRGKTHCHRGHLLSDDNVRIYDGSRHCLTCKRDRKRGYRANRMG